MNHLDLLLTRDYIHWNQERARLNYTDKIGLDQCRAWWREMCRAFEDHIVVTTLPVPANGLSHSQATMNIFAEFAETINRLSRLHHLPAPFAETHTSDIEIDQDDE